MTTQDLRPYLGKLCQVIVRCRPCRQEHLLAAELGRGRNAGEVLIEGHSYSIDDIAAVRLAPSELHWLPAGRMDLLRWSALIGLLGSALAAWMQLRFH